MSAMSALDSSARACVASQPAAGLRRQSRNDTCKVAAFLTPKEPAIAVGSQGLNRLTWNNRRGSVAARGILDAYRKDKGLLERQKEAFRQNNEGQSQSANEEDDETCPAECVKEIREGENTYNNCSVQTVHMLCFCESHHTCAMLALSGSILVELCIELSLPTCSRGT